MRLLLISDLHANHEAFDAVMNAAPDYDLVANLGDVVGYNASPNEVCGRAIALGGLIVRGNHDRACSGLTDLSDFNPVAAISARWTQTSLNAEHLQWLRELPKGSIRREALPGVEFVHGAPEDEDEYLLNTIGAEESFSMPGQADIVFFGHTHLQGGFLEEVGKVRQFVPSYGSVEGAVHSDMELRSGTRYLINPGSVGQPRDGDWRAAFALYEKQGDEPGGIRFYRVPYEIDRAQERILSANLPPRLAMRLRLGR
jgi:diadenosine tetraphosphatase ApaH/serine/threonine PP2A family protein phosphatase